MTRDQIEDIIRQSVKDIAHESRQEFRDLLARSAARAHQLLEEHGSSPNFPTLAASTSRAIALDAATTAFHVEATVVRERLTGVLLGILNTAIIAV